MKRILSCGVIAVMLALAATGCFGGDKKTGPSPTDTGASSSAAGTAPPPAASGTAPSTETPSPPPEPSQNVLAGTGKLVGLVDNHSVEIETGNGPAVFQISQEIRDRVENWETGTPVRFEYVKETLQTGSGRVDVMRLVSIDEQS